MRIRLQMALLMAAVVTPAALVAVSSYASFFDAQRQAHLQRFQERVNGVRLALENEQRHSFNILEGFARSSPLEPDNAARAAPRLDRLLALNPAWSAVVLIDAREREIARAVRDGAPTGLRLDAPTLEKTLRQKKACVSDLVALDRAGQHVTYFAAPVMEGDTAIGVVYASVDHRAWVSLLRTYPIAKDATLTLNDSDGSIIARTLNHEQWVGKQSTPGYWMRTIGQQQGAFQSSGLEGQSFYSAFSRLGTSDWVLGTGVPAATVEEALVAPAVMSLGGMLLTLGIAGGVAVLLARRITSSLDHLAAVASSDETATAPDRPLPIVEAEEVRRRLREAIASERRQRAAAEHAAREKDSFLAMLAHELRNPLSAIRAAVAVIGNPRASAETGQRAQEVLSRQVRQMAEMVDAMLDAARLSSGKVAIDQVPVDLAAALQRVLTTFEQTRRTAHLDLQVSLAPVVVQGDETRLEQVFANLLDNAAKYTPQGGKVRISTRRDGATAEVRVEDTGSGIEPDLLPHVFDAFSQNTRTLDRSQGGLGLGLNVVRELVALHGGTVTAESRGPGLGATFIVRLPAVEAEPSGELPPVRTAAPPPGASPLLKPLRIAVIDDNRDNAETVATLLRLAGHQVVTAHEGPSGIALVQGQASEVALIDVGLPDIDGLEVARRLKASGTAALLIAFTGYGDEQIRGRIVEAGFDGYLQKPFDAAKFQALVLAAWAAEPSLKRREGNGPA